MNAVSHTTTASLVRTRPTLAMSALAAPAAVYVVALVARLVALAVVPFSLNEGSAYYVAVARNMVEGHGTVIDALWSYSTPPLTLPRQAFELWQPMASVIAAWPMTIFGPTFTSAQIGFALFGALLGPLAWWVAADAVRRLDLPANRARAVAVGTGLLVAVGAPFVMAAGVPNSTLPFTVFAVGACIAMPAAARGSTRAVVALGLLLGLAYLTRMEAIYLGLAFIAIAWNSGVRGRLLIVRVSATALVGAAVALPWWLRNSAVFGTPLPGQLADNAFLTRNEQIFAFHDQPTLAAFLAQGPGTLAANIGAGAVHNLVDVLLLPATVIVLAGVVTLVAGWRWRQPLMSAPVGALLIHGAIAFAVATLVFPVATLWGTFAHSAGPLLVGLSVLAVVGADGFVARVRMWRGWSRPNAWLAPVALLSVSVVLTALQLSLGGGQAVQRQRQIAAVAVAVGSATAADSARPIITDRPIWLSDALGSPTLALPEEDASSVLDLARAFGATAVVVVEGTTENSRTLASDETGCFVRQSVTAPPEAPHLSVFEIADGCR